MYSTITQEFATHAERLRAESAALVSRLTELEAPGGERIDLQQTIPNSLSSIAEMKARLFGLADIASTLAEQSSDKFLLVPSNHLTGFSQEIGQIIAALQGIATSIASLQSAGEGLGSFEQISLVLRSRNNSHAVNLGELLTSVDKQIDAGLDRAHRIAAIVTPKSYGGFSAATNALKQFIEHVATLSEQTSKQLSEAVADRKAASSAARTASEREAQVGEAASDAAKSLEVIRTQRQQTDELLKNATEVAANATALKNQVDNYAPKFAQFDKQLADRNTFFESGKIELNDLVQKMQIHENSAHSIIDNAKTALQWGTAEGLAKSFATSASELDKPLENATTTLHISLFVLAMWAVAVFLVPQIIDPSLEILKTPEHLDGLSAFPYILSTVVIRLVLVSPALFFFLFANARYRAIFGTREIYTFKKTVAAAIPGFKEQAAAQDADLHVKAMTAAAFERLLFNPRDRGVDVMAESRNLGFLSSWLYKTIRKAFDESAVVKK